MNNRRQEQTQSFDDDCIIVDEQLADENATTQSGTQAKDTQHATPQVNDHGMYQEINIGHYGSGEKRRRAHHGSEEKRRPAFAAGPTPAKHSLTISADASESSGPPKKQKKGTQNTQEIFPGFQIMKTEQATDPCIDDLPQQENTEHIAPTEHHSDPVQNTKTLSKKEMRAQLKRTKDRLAQSSTSLDARVRDETMGSVPTSHDVNAYPTGASELTERDWEGYESRIYELEHRLEILEKRLGEESTWSRSMGTFLYDANGRNLETFKDVFAAITTLHEVSASMASKKTPSRS